PAGKAWSSRSPGRFSLSRATRVRWLHGAPAWRIETAEVAPSGDKYGLARLAAPEPCSVTLISLMAGECRVGTEVAVANQPKVSRAGAEGVLSPRRRTCTGRWCRGPDLNRRHLDFQSSLQMHLIYWSSQAPFDMRRAS